MDVGDRCYECPVTALEEAMDSASGALINRVFRKSKLMAAGVCYGPEDFTVEEARVLEFIELERQSSDPDGSHE